MAASGSGYSNLNGFKLRLLSFCPSSFCRQLLLPPSVMPWGCLRRSSDSSSNWAFCQGSFWAGSCCWTSCMSIIARKGLIYVGSSCHRAALWAKDKDCTSLTGWTAPCWHSSVKVLVLPLYFSYRVAAGSCSHTNMWLNTQSCCTSAVVRSHKAAWRPGRSLRGKVCSELQSWGHGPQGRQDVAEL